MQIPRPVDPKTGKPKGKLEYFLPSFDTKIENNCMPLGYSFENCHQNSEPCINTKCDLDSCSETGSFTRLQCFHTFHTTCLNGETQCPICSPYLKDNIKKLAESFNSSLLEPTKSSNPSVTTDNLQSNEGNESNVNAMPPCYYKSAEWRNEIQKILDSFPVVNQPTIKRKSTSTNDNQGMPPTFVQRKCSNCHQPGRTRSRNGQITCPQLLNQQQNSQRISNVHPCPTPLATSNPRPAPQAYLITCDNKNSIQFCFFPYQVSQSTVNGRQSSTACALIALLMAHKYHNQNSSLPVHTQLSPAWFNLIVSSILEGNTIHDNVFQHMPVTLQIPMASSLLVGSIGQIRLGQELPVNFTSENGPTSSNLDYHLGDMVNNSTSSPPSAIIVTFRGNTFSFVPGKQNNLIFLDSHVHHPFGALIASVPSTHIPELLKWIKLQYLGTAYNLCSFTAIYF